MEFRKSRLNPVAGIAMALLLSSAAFSQITIQPITWDIVGLDSNKVNTGPDTFPIGVRIHNTSATETNTNVNVAFMWDDPSMTDLYLEGAGVKTIATLAPLENRDIYFSIKIIRKLDYFKVKDYPRSRLYHVSVASNQYTTPVSTPLNRQIYIEQLNSQQRNSVIQLIGPTEIFIGHSYTYRLLASTATNGYEQLTAWPLFPGQAFERVDTYFTATAPPGYTSDKIYADACTWDPNVGSATYSTCLGTGKVGGDITVDLTVIPLIQGVYRIDQLIYDYSGSSFHYNQDFNSQLGSITVRNYLPAKVGDMVWSDNNFNGAYDPGVDTGIPGVQMRLAEAGADGVFGTADDITTFSLRTTNGLGQYDFDPLFPGNYRVAVNSVPGVRLPVTGNTGSVDRTLIEGETDLTADFGYFNIPLLVDLNQLAAVTPGEGLPVQIAWETSAEFDNAGFNVYRAEQRLLSLAIRPGAKLNPFMIPAQGTETEGAFYQFMDLEPYSESDTSRAYYLEDIDLSGQSTFHGPIPVQVTKNFLRAGEPSSIPDWMLY